MAKDDSAPEAVEARMGRVPGGLRAASTSQKHLHCSGRVGGTCMVSPTPFVSTLLLGKLRQEVAHACLVTRVHVQPVSTWLAFPTFPTR